MIKTIRPLKGSWFGRLLIGALCVSVLMLAIPAKAPATAIEYAVMLALIPILIILDAQVSNEPWHVAWGVVGNHLLVAANSAFEANSQGNRDQEISSLSKAAGAAEALMGMSSSCDACGEVRNELQEVIGLIALLKSRALGVSGCHPDGIIQGNEQCDPLAVPTGCPVITTFELSYSCNDQCQCVGTNIIP